MSHPRPAERSRDWYQANARRYDRRHPGLPGDASFYASLARGTRVLEIGAGTGRVTLPIAGSAHLVVALDRAPAMLAVAAERLKQAGNVRLLCADAQALPLRGPFDLAVLAYRVLQHLPSDARAEMLATIRALLAADGRLAFDTWHGPPPGARRSAASDVSLTPVTVEELGRELRAAGFDVVRLASSFVPGGAEPDGFTRVWLARAVA